MSRCRAAPVRRVCLATGMLWLGVTAAQAADAGSALRAALRDRHPQIKALLVRRGSCPAFDYYRGDVGPDTRMPLHSMTKSVLSGLVGIAQARGKLGFGERLGELLPETLDAGIDKRLRGVTVRQVMSMTAGLDAEAKPPPGLSPAALGRWSLTRPFLSEPGRQFRYDNYGANLLSVMLTRQTGQTAEAFGRDVLFGPLGIRNYTWLDDGDGHSTGAYGLWLTAPDMAKVGLLYLHHGRFDGRQIVPEAFVDASTRRQSAGGPPFYAAYGYYWWVRATRGGQAAFAAIGSDGQVIEVVPKRDLVVVLASDKAEPGGSLGFLDTMVLPAAASPLACLSAPAGR